ncbi:hypothetical protein ACLKA6_018539 [Drosophila palustris]
MRKPREKREKEKALTSGPPPLAHKPAKTGLQPKSLTPGGKHFEKHHDAERYTRESQEGLRSCLNRCSLFGGILRCRSAANRLSGAIPAMTSAASSDTVRKQEATLKAQRL